MQNFLNSPPGITQKNKKIANHLILVISDFIIHLYLWSHLDPFFRKQKETLGYTKK